MSTLKQHAKHLWRNIKYTFSWYDFSRFLYQLGGPISAIYHILEAIGIHIENDWALKGSQLLKYSALVQRSVWQITKEALFLAIFGPVVAFGKIIKYTILPVINLAFMLFRLLPVGYLIHLIIEVMYKDELPPRSYLDFVLPERWTALFNRWIKDLVLASLNSKVMQRVKYENTITDFLRETVSRRKGAQGSKDHLVDNKIGKAKMISRYKKGKEEDCLTDKVRDKHSFFILERNKHRYSDGESVYSFTVTPESKNGDQQNQGPQKYLVMLVGNAVIADDKSRLEEMDNLAYTTGRTVICVERRGVGWEYPERAKKGNCMGYPRDFESGIIDGIEFVRSLVEKKKIPAKNICLYGESLGGAEANCIAGELHRTGIQVHLMVSRSFTSFPRYIAGLLVNKKLPQIILEIIVTPLCGLLGLNSAPGEAFKSVPYAHKALIQAKKDKIMPEYSALATQEAIRLEVMGDGWYECKDLIGHIHSASLDQLIRQDKNSKRVSALDHLKEFCNPKEISTGAIEEQKHEQINWKRYITIGLISTVFTAAIIALAIFFPPVAAISIVLLTNAMVTSGLSSILASTLAISTFSLPLLLFTTNYLSHTATSPNRKVNAFVGSCQPRLPFEEADTVNEEKNSNDSSKQSFSSSESNNVVRKQRSISSRRTAQLANDNYGCFFRSTSSSREYKSGSKPAAQSRSPTYRCS